MTPNRLSRPGQGSPKLSSDVMFSGISGLSSMWPRMCATSISDLQSLRVSESAPPSARNWSLPRNSWRCHGRTHTGVILVLLCPPRRSRSVLPVGAASRSGLVCPDLVTGVPISLVTASFGQGITVPFLEAGHSSGLAHQLLLLLQFLPKPSHPNTCQTASAPFLQPAGGFLVWTGHSPPLYKGLQQPAESWSPSCPSSGSSCFPWALATTLPRLSSMQLLRGHSVEPRSRAQAPEVDHFTCATMGKFLNLSVPVSSSRQWWRQSQFLPRVLVKTAKRVAWIEFLEQALSQAMLAVASIISISSNSSSSSSISITVHSKSTAGLGPRVRLPLTPGCVTSVRLLSSQCPVLPLVKLT